MRKVLKYYLNAWKWAILNWKLIALLFSFNLVLSYLTLKPISQFLSSILSSSIIPDHFNSRFDFTIISDTLRTNPEILNSSLSLILPSIGIYLIWIIFSSAGIINMANNGIGKQNLSDFWSGGSKYFFRYLRLSTYYVLLICILAFVFFKIFSLGGLNVLFLDNEDILIRKFHILSATLIVILFLLKTILDSVKVQIQIDNKAMISSSILKATFMLLKSRIIMLSLLSMLFSIGLLIILNYFKINLQSSTLLILTTMFLLALRMMGKVGRIVSFNLLAKDA